MSSEIQLILQQVEKIKNIERADLIKAFERGITSAARKVYGIKTKIRVEFTDSDIKFFWLKIVVENVKNEYTEISLEEARQINQDIKLGDEIEVLFYPKEFGRIAAQTTKQVISQKIREIEKEQLFQEYKNKEGEIITGVVHTIEENGNFIIDLGAAEGILRKKEQVAREKFKIGDRIRAYILKVKRGKESPFLELSRTHPNFIKKIFAMEITEIDQGIVEVMYVAREPGIKTKVVVMSKDSHIDPVGACIGVKGSRIQTIINELQGEKVDVVLFSDDIKKYLESAVAPIPIKNIYIDELNKYAIIAVPDDQFSQVIGKNGINMRLVAKITKWKVSVLRESEFTEDKLNEMKKSFEEQLEYDLFKLNDISVSLLKKLKQAGIKNLKDFMSARNFQLAEILNKEEEQIKKLKDRAIEIIEQEKLKSTEKEGQNENI